MLLFGWDRGGAFWSCSDSAIWTFNPLGSTEDHYMNIYMNPGMFSSKTLISFNWRKKEWTSWMTWGWVDYQDIFIQEANLYFNMENGSSDCLNVPHTKKKRFAESFFGKPKLFYWITLKPPFATFVFKSVVCDLWQRSFEYLLDCILRQEDWEDMDPGAS